MLSERSIYNVQSSCNVTNISREEEVSFEDYVAQCRIFTVNNMSSDSVSADWDPDKKHKYLVSLIQEFVNRHQVRVTGYVTDLGTVNLNDLLNDVVDAVTGLGILKDAFENPEIDEIQINDYKTIFVVENGVTKPLVDKKGRVLQFFNNDEIHILFVKLVEDGTGNVPQFTEGKPIINTKTAKDQYRVSAVHFSANARDTQPYQFPITSMVIRKFRKVKLTMDDLVRGNTLTPKMGRFLKLLGRADVTLFCVGKTGSGKTTLLNIIAGEIPRNRRLLLVQNPTEMTFFERDEMGRNTRNAVHWEVREGQEKEGVTDTTSATMENLMSNTLRFTPEITIIGEARTHGEFEQIKRSVQMGQPVMGTFHAADSVDAIGRMATEVDGGSVETKKLFSRATDIIISQFRYPDGTRRILEISEILGVDADGEVKINKLFEFTETGEVVTNPKNGLPHSLGAFKQCNPISEGLKKKFFRSAIPLSEIEEFLTVDESEEIKLV